ncbi:MAG: xylB 1 [Nocardioidaceae bacterium]|jgi:xylulokinase|nr:xylB 1 [Nocardioidaceae bacterium]
MPLVAGIDSSTQSCKVVVRDADSGALVREGRAAHPDATEVDVRAWWSALEEAAEAAGGLDDVGAVAVGAQQHGLVALGENGEPVRDALLWNDTRSADAATELILELGDGDEAKGREEWATAVGVVPVASFTVAKARWVADNEPDNAKATAAICLPHDWVTWRLRGGRLGTDELTTDAGDASGTGWYDPVSGQYRLDLLERGLGHRADLPRVAAPGEAVGEAGELAAGALLGPGTGDNAAAALGLGAGPGDVVVSIGTSGVVSGSTDERIHDPSGIVAGFCDAEGHRLPLVCTLNASRVLSATAQLLGVDLDELSRLALSAPVGSEGIVLVPYLEGERTPDRPRASGAVHGLRVANSQPANLARAAVEGLLCGLADGIDALRDQGVEIRRALLIGGGAKSEALRVIAPSIFGCPVEVPAPDEYVANGAARQAAWVLSGADSPPAWQVEVTAAEQAEPTPAVRERYAEVRDLTEGRDP